MRPPLLRRLCAFLFLLQCQGAAGFSPARSGTAGAACRSPLFVRPTIAGRARAAFEKTAPGGAYYDGEARAAAKDGRLSARREAAGSDKEGEEEEDDDGYAPPSYAKSSDDKALLRTTLKASFIFGDLPRDALDDLVQAFSPVQYDEGTEIIRQGDVDADCMYILAKGECGVSIDGKTLPGTYGRTAEGSMIGELGLLYDKARAATITANTDVSLFRLDRRSFNYFMNSKPDAKPENVAKELKKIDRAIDKIAGIKSRYKEGTIIRQFKPQRSWLWFRWTGTVLQHAWKAAVFNMLLSAATIAWVNSAAGGTWLWGTTPDPKASPIIARFATFSKVWHYIMNITTFILTFFLSQAYSLWRKIYGDARKIQGKLNDVGMLLASAAKRNEDGSYDPRSEAVLDDVALYSRLFHTFFWAKHATKYRILLRSRGMRRMVNRGLMTWEQRKALRNLDDSVGGPHHAILEWIIIRASRAMEDGSLDHDHSLKHVLYDELCVLRGTAAGVGDALDGRMPLAYAHFVQILVDTFLITAPFALYAELGAWSVLSVGILTLFYSGLLDLAKIFLDPLDNDDFYKESVNMDVGVLIREGNAGSTRWKLGAENLPF